MTFQQTPLFEVFVTFQSVDQELLAAAVVLLGKALYPHCLVPRKGIIKPLVPWLLAYKELAFLVAR